MTIQYKGIRRKTTDVLDDYGQAHYAQNVRFRRVGELDRRSGIGKSTMAQLAGPVQFMIAGWNYEPFVVNGTGGSVTGNSDPLAYWTGATMRIPDGQVGQPAAPVITGVVFSPATGTPFSASTVDMTVSYTYDGLSGPLTWEFPTLTDGFGFSITVVNSVDNVCTYFSNVPANVYANSAPDFLRCYTFVGPLFSNNFNPSFTVV
jgi:hypothetical protein